MMKIHSIKIFLDEDEFQGGNLNRFRGKQPKPEARDKLRMAAYQTQLMPASLTTSYVPIDVIGALSTR